MIEDRLRMTGQTELLSSARCRDGVNVFLQNYVSGLSVCECVLTMVFTPCY